jgi:signal transduction histidine kinase
LPFTDLEFDKWLKKVFDAIYYDIQRGTKSELDGVINEFVIAMQSFGIEFNTIIRSFLPIGSILPENNLSKGTGSDNRFCSSGFNPLLLNSFSSVMSNCISQMVAAYKKEKETSANLFSLVNKANSCLDLGEVLSVISDEIVRAVDALEVSGYLFPNRSRYGNYYLLYPNPLPGYIVPDPPELFGLDALKRKEMVTCYDASVDPRTDKYTVQLYNLKSLMAFPLIAQGNVVAAGIVTMKDYHHFTQEEIDLVRGIANITASSVGNANYHEMSLQIAVTQERNRMAQEIHDDLAQSLAISKLNLNTLLQTDLPNPVRTTVEDTKDLIDTCYTDLRSNIYGLRESNGSRENFIENIKEYNTIFFASSGINVNLSIQEANFISVPNETIFQITRIVEEAMSNIRKHSNARNAWISSNKEEGWLTIKVEDDGIGIRSEELNGIGKNHFGVKIMAERAELIGGSLSIKERLTGGTCIVLKVPLRKERMNKNE